jgi:hypothetical protein
MVTADARTPTAEGVNVTLRVHVPPTASEFPHVFDCAKSAAFPPVMPMFIIVSEALPVFAIVTT